MAYIIIKDIGKQCSISKRICANVMFTYGIFIEGSLKAICSLQEENVLACLPLEYTQEEYNKRDGE